MWFGVLLFCAASAAWAQLPRLLPIATDNFYSVPAVAGPEGDLWVAGSHDVMRLGHDGHVRFSVRLDVPGTILGMAVGSDGAAGILSSANSTGRLTVLSPLGDVTVSKDLAGWPASIASDGKGGWVVAGRAQDGFVGTHGAYRSDMGAKNCSYMKGQDVACDDAYVMKLDGVGDLVWATLFGGASDDLARIVAVDEDGAVWIAGETKSVDMPVTATATQPIYGGGETLGPLWYGDTFIAKFDPSGTRLQYSTYLGGSRMDQVNTLAVVPDGILLGGRTESPNFPIAGAAHQRALLNMESSLPGMNTEAFLSLFSREGALQYSTFFGGARATGGAGLGDGGVVRVSAGGRSDELCVVDVQLAGAQTKLKPGCGLSSIIADPHPVYWNNAWIAVGKSAPGLPIIGINTSPYISLTPFGDATPPPAVTAVWAPVYPGYRPAVTPDSVATLYLPSETNLTGVSINIGGLPAPILFAGNRQINFYIPAGVPWGMQPVSVELPFFGGIPVPVDVAPRIPGLGGTVEGSAARGEVVRLIATGLGASPYTGLQAFIEAGDGLAAQGMEILGINRVADGVFHVSVRIPQNAKRPGAEVRLVFQGEGQPILSNLVGVGVQ